MVKPAKLFSIIYGTVRRHFGILSKNKLFYGLYYIIRCAVEI